MTQTTVTEFQTKVESVRKYTGSGTELVSVYLPPDASLSSMRQRIKNEYSQAQNIKNKSTRQNVQDALSSVESVLQSYDSVPENGLVVLSGVVKQTNSAEHITQTLDDLPQPIGTQVYHCDDEFFTEPLESLGIDEAVYAIIVLDRNDAAVGQMTNGAVETLVTLSSLVPGKQKKGGQSQQRFERLRLEAIDNHYQKVAKKANEAFVSERHDIKGFLIGGPEITRKEFIDGAYLHHELQDKIIFSDSITSADEAGVNEIAEKAAERIEESEVAEQKAICEEFFKKIASNEATYGVESVAEAIKYGSVETLVLSTEYYPNPSSNIQELIDETEAFGGDIAIIPDSFEKGEQFKNGFGGVGAILRYQIE